MVRVMGLADRLHYNVYRFFENLLRNKWTNLTVDWNKRSFHAHDPLPKLLKQSFLSLLLVLLSNCNEY